MIAPPGAVTFFGRPIASNSVTVSGPVPELDGLETRETRLSAS